VYSVFDLFRLGQDGYCGVGGSGVGGADCDTDHSLIVAEIRERLVVNK
jgi:hypothetical protein